MINILVEVWADVKYRLGRNCRGTVTKSEGVTPRVAFAVSHITAFDNGCLLKVAQMYRKLHFRNNLFGACFLSYWVIESKENGWEKLGKSHSAERNVYFFFFS